MTLHRHDTGTGAVRVRAATPVDADTVHTLVGEIAAHQSQSAHVTANVARWRQMLARPDVTVLLAELDGHAVGYVSAVRRLHLWPGDDVIALDDLYVRPGHRDHGIGEQLMHALACRAGDHTITWGVQPDNHAAIRFYERLGAAVRTKVVCTWSSAARSAEPTGR